MSVSSIFSCSMTTPKNGFPSLSSSRWMEDHRVIVAYDGASAVDASAATRWMWAFLTL